MTRRILPGLLACLALAACRAPLPRPEHAGVVPSFPDAVYRRAAARGEAVYDLDASRSTLRVFVFPAGALASFGHSHVIEAGSFRGAVTWPEDDVSRARLDLAVPVGDMRVDPPAVRRALGGAVGEVVDADARQGTRANMLGPEVLDAEHYPRIAVTLAAVHGDLPRPILDLKVFVRGSAATVTVPVAVSIDGDGIVADGRAVLRQSSLGMTPFSAAAGALQVADPVVVDFHLVGRRRASVTEDR